MPSVFVFVSIASGYEGGKPTAKGDSRQSAVEQP